MIDAQSYEVMRYLLVGQRVWSLAFNPDQSRLYTTNGVSNDITVIEVGSLKAIKSVPVGPIAVGRGLSPMRKRYPRPNSSANSLPVVSRGLKIPLPLGFN